MKIRIDQFKGLVPKLSAPVLPDSAGQVSVNLRMNSGTLRSINTPAVESTKVNSGAASVYMLGSPGSQIPLTWAPDVDVAPSPVADSEYKVYYTGDSVPKKTYLSQAGGGSGPYPYDWYHWGVPAPTSALTLGTTTGSVPAGTYAYLFTYVTQFGATLTEESAPSPAATVTLGGTGGVTITFPTNPSTTNRNYVYKRIYRTTGSAYQMVAQVAFVTGSYTDTLSATAIAGDSLLTAGWLPPKDDLKGVITLPGGAMAGFRNNEIWFCEPGYPHAWPVSYMQTVDSTIVGIKAYGNTIVITTTSFPYAGSGVHPSSFTLRKLPMMEPCLGKRTMASDEYGVMYISSNGIVSVGDDGYGVVTQDHISRDSFVQFAPDTFTAAVYARRYYGFYNSSTYGKGVFVYAKNDSAPVTTLDTFGTAVTVDQRTARMLYVDGVDNKLYRFDPPDTVPNTYTWKSKLFQELYPVNLGCFRIVSSELTAADLSYQASIDSQNAAIDAANATTFSVGPLNIGLNGVEFNNVALDDSAMQARIPSVSQAVNVTVWSGRSQIFSGSATLNKVYRLPSGFRNLSWEIGVSGQREVYALELATSPQELGNG